METNKVKSLIEVLIVIVTLIIFPVFIYSLISVIRDRDVLINSDKYNKVNVVIDSIRDGDIEGATGGNFYGYSRSLDNYKSEILFGCIMDDEYPKGLGLDNLGKRMIWYRKGIKYAYPAIANDKNFPLKEFIYKKIKTPSLFLLLLLLSFYIYRNNKKKL